MSLTFVNMVKDSTVWVAYLYYNGGCSGSPFQKEGWYSAPYGGSVTVWNGDCAWLNRYWYFYAFTEGITPQVSWSGPLNVTVNEGRVINQCQWDNANMNLTVGMQEIDIGINWDYTLTLCPPGGCPPAPPTSGDGGPGDGDGGDGWGDGDGDGS